MDVVILKSFIPEVFLSLAILFFVIFNVRSITDLQHNFEIPDNEVLGQTLFILILLFLLFLNVNVEGSFSSSIFTNDLSILFLKKSLVLISIISLIIAFLPFFAQKLNFFEFFVFYLFTVLSLLLLLSSSDLISFYLLIEMQALCFYILASFRRNSSLSAESGLKYFVSGAFISGIFLFGCTLLYGSLGTLNLNQLGILLFYSFNNYDYNFLHAVGCGVICITVTLLFKLSCAPFHFWSPDVYDGAPLASTVIFSVLPKTSLLYFFFKWNCGLSNFFDEVGTMLLCFGVFSAFLGTFCAISQKRLKKLLIYSSIGQTGIIVSSLSINSFDGYVHVFFFVSIYIITSTLIWGILSSFNFFQYYVNYIEKKNLSSFFLSDLTGLFPLHRIWCVCCIIALFSMGGVPPFAGFLSKILLLYSMLKGGLILVASLIILISSVSIFYYIRLLKIIFFEPGVSTKGYEKFQVIFHNFFLDFIFIIVTFVTFLIFYLFFFSTSFILGSNFAVITSVFF